MFDLRNLNDYEFEMLCKDIMEKKLKIKLRIYKRGRDGGVDINDYSGKNNVLIQVKHYINSTYSNLKTALSKEKDNVGNIRPKQYYICSGLALSAGNVKSIFGFFEDYMNSTENIVDSTQICEFLELESNNDLVKKYYKLWLSASNVLNLVNNQNVFLDCDELVYEIEKESKLYVETSAYLEAKKVLYKENAIIIQGSPGVGKSTLSKMLLLHFVNEGYCVRYSTENNLSDLKKVLSNDLNKKEIVLLDDFLGQHYLKIKESQPNEIKTLISFIKRKSNKKLIMNTRITILNEAKSVNINFRKLIEDNDVNLYMLDLDKMKDVEKAKILYNHIYFNNIPRGYFNAIRQDKNYLRIIKHNNYNPRIIEYVTKARNYKEVDPSFYFQYINDKLNNPHDVWEDEFENRMTSIDRIFMNTLYSLTNSYISSNLLERGFNNRTLEEKGIDTTLNHYDKTLVRLGNSLIKIVEEEGLKKIGVINPSINDFIYSSIKSNINEQRNILKSAAYIEQFEKLINDSTKDLLIQKVVDGSF